MTEFVKYADEFVRNPDSASAINTHLQRYVPKMDRLESIRSEFPVTAQTFIAPDGETRRVIYLDHGASTHPPKTVLEFYTSFLQQHYANIHRGNHYLSQRASELFDHVTETVLRFVGADAGESQVIFTLNTTGAIDVASHLMSSIDGATIVTEMEHHSNDLPHRSRGEVLRVSVDRNGMLDYDELERLLKNNRIKLVAVTGGSNVTGYMPDIHRIARLAHEHGARILVDAAQLLAHAKIQMQGEDPAERIDFLAAAGHKAYAPFGAAFLVAPNDLCDSSNPYIPGGGTVKFVTSDNVIWADGHERHQGGTPNIPGVIALGRALEWLEEIGLDWIHEHESELLEHYLKGLSTVEGIEIYGNIPSDQKLGVIAFNIPGYSHPVASAILNNRYGIATRNGCFCAQPYLTRLMENDPDDCMARFTVGNVGDRPGAVRGTIGIFNNQDDIDALVSALREMVDHPEWAAEFGETDNLHCIDVAG